MTDILLISNFEGGFQPLTIASAAGFLNKNGFSYDVLDTYVEGIKEEKLLGKKLIAISIPLFDSVNAAIEMTKIIREVNPTAHVTYFGQHATINYKHFTDNYSDSCICGEWEYPLFLLAKNIIHAEVVELEGVYTKVMAQRNISLHPYMGRKHIVIPDRSQLPDIKKYPQKQVNNLLGYEATVGNTDIARGCHHKCLYCSVFAAYDGKVIMINEEVILNDVHNMVKAGITHLTFTDADFFNSKVHGIRLLKKLHELYPTLTYDFTTRIDHVLENKEKLKEMKQLNVKFITSALEFPNEEVLDAVAKNTKVADIEEAIQFLREIDIKLNPTFIMFNPWTSYEDISIFRDFIEKNNLSELVDPIQYETRLYLYKGSPLLHSPSIKKLELTEYEFYYEWKHPDERLDELYSSMLTPQEEGVFKRCCLKC